MILGLMCLYKNLHVYIEISNKKESTANFSGDGPPKNGNPLTLELKSLQIFAMQRNGIKISKSRSNCPFIVEAIDISIFQSRISQPINAAAEVGYIVTKINDNDLLLYDNISAARLLATTNIYSINMYSPIEYRKLQKKSTYQKNKVNTNSTNSANETAITKSTSLTNQAISKSFSNATIQANNISTFNMTSSSNSSNDELHYLQHMAMILNGLNITKINSFSSFKVVEINMSILKTRISNNLSIGDIVFEINDIQLQVHDNLFAARLLSSEILVSIRSYLPQRIENETTPTTSNVYNNSSSTDVASPIIVSPVNSNYSSSSQSIINARFIDSTNSTELTPSNRTVNNNPRSETTPDRRNLNMNFENETSPEIRSNRVSNNNTNNI